MAYKKTASDGVALTLDGAAFDHNYWRSVEAIGHPLPQLSPSAIDDATFHLLADNIPTLCWVANGDGYIVWYNRRWHDYCGEPATIGHGVAGIETKIQQRIFKLVLFYQEPSRPATGGSTNARLATAESRPVSMSL
jgi:PAS domain-containing protein